MVSKTEGNGVENDDTGNNDENTSIKDERTCCWGLVKRRTLLVIWGTITVTLTNFGYFTGGFYAFNYYQTEYFEEQRNNGIILLAEREQLFTQYPILQNSSNLVTYNRAAELLCQITKYPRKRWSFWAAFDFCVSIITTVGYGVLHPSTWYSKVACCLYAMAGLPLYILMLGASGKFIVSMFEKMNEKSSFVKVVCKHRYTELIIAYINIAIIMSLFLLGYSYFGYSSSRKGEIFQNSSVISLPGYGYALTKNEITVYGQNWTLYQGIYYSMISLTTVGFGDYYLGRPDDPRQAAMLFSSVTFGFALFSYAFQTYAKLSEETMKYLHEKTEAATKAAANAAMGELGNFADKNSFTGRLSKLGSTGGLSSHKSDTESTPEESGL
ncbi:two pore potassium channel protein sup-9-like isoform X2 [Bolinopsis microptera]|uniref:two pore potassium channel protein sup-9-like isoform X2 n=1 Tax=Bolinopsis microptera TaxID=2820187 RepID=UPI00307AF122